MKLQTSTRGRPRSLNAAVAEIAATVLVHVSFWLLLSTMLGMTLPLYAVAILAMLPILLYFTAQVPSFGRLQPVFAVFLPLLAFLVGFRFFAKGFRELFNFFAKAMNRVHPLSVFPTMDGFPDGDRPGTAATAAVLVLSVLTAGLLSYAICRKNRPLAAALTMVPAALGFLAGLRPTVPVFVFYLVSVTFYLILLTTRSKGTARRLTWLNGEISAALLVFLLILALLFGSFEQSAAVDRFREQMSQKVTAFRYAPDEEADGMPGGDLHAADAVSYDGRTVLTVETPNAFSMYLRGFSGDVLDDGAWTPLSADAYFHDYSLTGPWIRSSAFDPAISLGQLLDLKWEVQTTQFDEGQRDKVTLARYPVTIRNERAYSDRVFAPYEVSGESKGLRRANLSQDGLFSGGLKGKRSYELTVYQPLTKDYGNVSGTALIGDDAEFHSLYRDEFTPTEKVYRQFVYANELAVPEEYSETVEAIWRTSVGTVSKPSDAVYRIRSLFAKQYTYSLEKAPDPGGTDPLLEFTRTRTGYDAHFATLATLLLRQAGYPARYAEGYLISEELAGSVEPETDVVLQVPDSAAHAWVELYLSGVGWVPVEVTPGYYETAPGSTAAGTTAREEPQQTAPEPEPREQPAETDEETGELPEDENDRTGEQEDSRLGLLLLLPALLLLLIAGILWYLRRRRAEPEETTEPIIRRDNMENKSAQILGEIKKVIVGKDEVITKTLMAILAGGHVLLEDVPGVGKTTLALAFSRAMNLTEKRVQFTPDTMASDILGFSIYNKATGQFEFQPGAVFSNILLADEINRTSAKTQAALLEAMEELHATVDGVTYALPDPFVCMATQNPLGSAGTHPLPDSQLDRFMIRLSMGYPSIESQIEIVQQRQGVDPLDSVRPVASARELLEMRAAVTAVYIDEALIRYAAELCDKTRHLEDVEQGVSPRAVLSLVQMAKASAYMRGRNYVIPEDIQSLYVDVCAHRLILTPRARIRKREPEQILREVLQSVKAPTQGARHK